MKTKTSPVPELTGSACTQLTLGAVTEGTLEELPVCPEGAKEIGRADQRRGPSTHKE